MRARGGLAAAVVLAASFAGCRTATQITVTVATDFGCANLTGVTIAIGHPGEIVGKKPTTSTRVCVGGRVGSLVVVPSGGRTDEVAIEILAGVKKPVEECTPPDYQGCIVARRSLHFVAHES